MFYSLVKAADKKVYAFSLQIFVWLSQSESSQSNRRKSLLLVYKYLYDYHSPVKATDKKGLCLIKPDKMSALNHVSQAFDDLSLKLKFYENIFTTVCENIFLTLQFHISREVFWKESNQLSHNYLLLLHIQLKYQESNDKTLLHKFKFKV